MNSTPLYLWQGVLYNTRAIKVDHRTPKPTKAKKKTRTVRHQPKKEETS